MNDESRTLEKRCRSRLNELQAQGQLRTLPAVGCRDGATIEFGGVRMLNLSANDYLGLAGDCRRRAAFLEADDTADGTARLGMGSSASRLLGGDHSPSLQLERELADAYGGGRASLLFNSGYHANVGILSALTRKGDLVLVDKLAHASIIDGLRLCDATWLRYRHGDLAHLVSLLESKRKKFDCVFIVTESVFSMDGDLADLPALVEIKNRYNAMLYVDEAHALGVRGTRGLGLAEACGLLNEVEVLVGTFGKALASLGAFAVLSPVLKSWLVNTMRPLIYSTALPPVIVNWTRQMFGEMQSMTGERDALAALSDWLRGAVAQAGRETRGASQIVPVILGDNDAAVDCADALRRDRVLVFPVRPPTVPAGTARLRLSLSAAMSRHQLEPVVARLRMEGGA